MVNCKVLTLQDKGIVYLIQQKIPNPLKEKKKFKVILETKSNAIPRTHLKQRNCIWSSITATL